MSMQFESDFECGNGEAFRIENDSDVWFEIRPDTGSTDRQWFYFAVRGAAGRNLAFHLTNTGATNMPGHWPHAHPVFSTDNGATWRHIPGERRHDADNGVYTFHHACQSEHELIAYHFPYSWTYHQQRVAHWANQPGVTYREIGRSVQNRPVDLLQFSPIEEGVIERVFWISARQHSAESPASFVIDGFIDWLVSGTEAARQFRQRALVFAVPMINPDGVVAGNYRDNIHGENLNRVWNDPDPARAPEVRAVMDAIEQWTSSGGRIDFFIDFHADSAAREHYAFHPSRDQLDVPAITDPESYYRETVRYLNLVGGHSPVFLKAKGLSFSDHDGVSYQYIRNEYGVYSLTPEGGYNGITHGPRAGTLMTPDDHRGVGRAFALALADFYGFGIGSKPGSAGLPSSG